MYSLPPDWAECPFLATRGSVVIYKILGKANAHSFVRARPLYQTMSGRYDFDSTRTSTANETVAGVQTPYHQIRNLSWRLRTRFRKTPRARQQELVLLKPNRFW